MPVDEIKLKARTNAVLSRVAGEIEKVKADQLRHAKCVSESAHMLGQIATTEKARVILAKLSTMAIKLEGAYTRNAGNLREEAVISDGLRNVNAGLSACYIAVAVGKIVDMYASATGVGKVVTSVKSSFLDMTDAMRNQDVAMAGAHAANITLLGLGGDAINLTKAFDDLQKILASILGLIKDFRVMWSGNDLNKVLPSFRQATPRLLGLIATFSDALRRATSLWATYQKLALPQLVPGVKPGLASVASENTTIIADSFAAIKFGIEAVANLCLALNSILDTWESWGASKQANALADRQLTATGAGRFELDLAEVAGLSDSDLLNAMHPLNAAPDARQLAFDTGMKAKQLQAEAARMHLMHAAMASRLGPLTAELNDSLTHIQATDTELRALRKEFQALEPGRDVYSLQVAVWLSDIDSRRARIAEAVCR